VVFSTNAVNDVGATVLQRGGNLPRWRVHGSSGSDGELQFNLLDLAADSTR